MKAGGASSRSFVGLINLRCSRDLAADYLVFSRLHKIIHLAEIYPQLADNNCDPQMAVYLPHNMTEIGRNSQKHHCLLICLGGGHLAAHYCNAYNWPEVRGAFSESKPVNALMLFYPVITTSPEFAPPGSFPKLLGKGKLTQEEKERFFCEHMVLEKHYPHLLLYNERCW